VSEETLRTFVAVRLPDDVRGRLAAVAAELRPRAPGLAWVRAENLHLTVRFLGAVGPATLERVQEAMGVAATAVTRFPVEVEGLGGFPSGRPPRVVWAGVTKGAAGLMELYALLDAALVARGVPGESRAFHPHVTLARARDRRGAARLEELLGAGPRFGQADVAALHLMRSELHPAGSRYSVLAAAPLRSPLGAA
jgi:2'-5' RNA ligase